MAEASAATADEAPEAPAKGSNAKKLILIAIVALVVLGGAGGAAYYFFGGSHADEAQSADEEAGDHASDTKAVKGKKGKKSKDAKKTKKPAAPAIYYKVDPALVVNFEAGGVTRFLQVAIEISTRDPVTAEELKQHDPVIRNDLLMLLGSQKQETIISREGKDQLRAQALEAVRKVVDSEGGEGAKVENVYFTSFVMQ